MNFVIPGASIFASFRGSAALAPFRHRVFTVIWVASLISNFGSLAQSVGASWLMTTIAPFPDMVALVQAAVALPILVFSLVAGAIADIWNRRGVMLIAQTFMLLISAVLAFLAYMDALTPWLLLAFTFALGSGAAFYGPAWQSSVGEQVPRSAVPNAIALNSLGFNLARALGPAIGGLLVAATGPQGAFIFNAISYIGLIVVLARWQPPATERRLPAESMLPAIEAGLRYALFSIGIRIVLVRALLFGFAASAVWALLPLVARELIAGGPLAYGVLLGALGTGAIIGALTSAPLRQHHDVEIIVRCAALVFALSAFLIAFIGYLPLLFLVLSAAGAAWVLTLSTFNITVQMSAPRWVLGRAMAVYQMTVFGAIALGSWVWGVVADWTDIRLALAISGGILALTLAFAKHFRLPDYSLHNLEPSGSWPEPEIALDFDPRSGPVVITVEYRVRQKDWATFTKAMRKMRGIRRRDGNRYWAIIQDMADPEIWIERFESATWLDHLRQHERATMSDEHIRSEILALHVGSSPPQVHHLLDRSMATIR